MKLFNLGNITEKLHKQDINRKAKKERGSDSS